MSWLRVLVATGAGLALALVVALWVSPPPWPLDTVEDRAVALLTAILILVAGAMPAGLMAFVVRVDRVESWQVPAPGPWAVLLLAGVVFLGGSCELVARQADTLAIEGWAAVLRQEEAAQQLVLVAEQARGVGDVERCTQALQPALEIEARARHQWARGLYLAGLHYPDDEGQTPVAGKQPDPGPSPPARSAQQLCTGLEPIEYSPRSQP